MCRWFAYISPTEPCLLEDVLITPAHGIAKQVSDHYLPGLVTHVPGESGKDKKAEADLRNRINNLDGFGLAWYTNSRADFVLNCNNSQPCTFKHSGPPGHNLNFHNMCANISTRILFAHIRAASGTPVVPINNHPFTFGRHTIMHNGSVSDFNAIRRQLSNLTAKDPYEATLGSTDSETIAALYMTYLTNSGDKSTWSQTYSLSEMKAALTKAYETVMTLQRDIVGADKMLANSLNFCVTDGEQLIAFRFRNHKLEQPPSLYWSTTAGVTLNRKYPGHPNEPDEETGNYVVINDNAHKEPEEHGKHVIVASEPSTYDVKEWKLIEKNCCVLVDKEGNMEVEEIEYDAEKLDAVARQGARPTVSVQP